MSVSALIVLVILEVKHFLFDFVFQTPYQLKNKGTYGHPGGLLHAGLHIGGTFLALLVIAPPLLLGAAILVAEFIVHYHIDWAKEYVGRRTGNGDTAFFWRMIGFDQLMHHLTYIAILVVLFM